MSEQGTLELIQTVLDGEASPAEAAELEELANGSSAARAEIEAMEELFNTIGRSGDVPLPAGLKDDIMGAIRARAAASPPEVVPFALASRKRRLWLVASLAAAALIAIVAYAPLLRTIGDDRGGLIGAMVSRPASPWSNVASASSPAGNAVLQRNGTAVRLEVTSAVPGTVVVSWDASTIALRGNPRSAGRHVLSCPAGGCPAVLFDAAGVPARLAVTLPAGTLLELAEAP